MMTKSLEDYLEMVHMLIQDVGRARIRDIAASLHVKMPSVIRAMAELKKLELVTQEPYGDVALTTKGKRLAAMILNRHHLLTAFLKKIGVSNEVAEKDACMMEHILSAETLAQIKVFMSADATPRVARKPRRRSASD